jgi:UDP-N-acetylglucosamine--N-acetylmuramyl-(pentapeptide) pyrophosphoryl-undecaprenol N-acetylglucosamine transferase
MNRTLMVMAGGTGGHVMPGLAVAELMRSRDWSVVWLGNPAGIEARLVARHDIDLHPVSLGGLRGKGLLTTLWWPLTLLRALAQSLCALRRTRPAVVLGMGGYVALPGGMMAALLGVPLVVHEQNSVAGFTNRLLARLAGRVLEAFPGSLPGASCTGNPVRASIAGLAPPRERYQGRTGPLQLLVVGGSLGAQVFNERVPEALALLSADHRPRVIHQTGRGRTDAVARRYAELGIEATVLEFLDDIGSAYAPAALVIARAGAMTVAEIAAAGVASVLVPYPHAVDDHQTGNARFLADQGAARLLAQAALDAGALADILRNQTRESALAMAERARTAGRIDSAHRIAQACEEMAR